MKWNKNNVLLRYNNDFLIANRDLNAWIIISDEVHEIICNYAKSLNKDAFLELYEKEDKEYLQSVISNMIKIKLLVDNEEERIVNSVSLSLTNGCNLNCIHCCMDANNSKVRYEKQVDYWLDIIDELSTNREIEEVTVTGGEPVLKKDFKKISCYLKEKLNCKLLLLTNGTLLDDEVIGWITGVYDSISISLDGGDKILTDFIRGHGVFEKVIQTVVKLKEKGFENISLSAILPNSIDCEEQFQKLCDELEVGCQVRPLSYMGRASENYISLKSIFDNYVHENKLEIADVYDNYEVANLSSCGMASRKMATFDPYGNIYPCNLFQENGMEISYHNGKTFYSENVENVISFKGTICEDCPVNVFCWSCLSDFNNIKNDSKQIEEKCKQKKKKLMFEIWGVTD